MKVFYLFSESSNTFHEQSRTHVKKIADKRECLTNFLRVFSNSDITLLVDGVTDATLEWLNKINGNSKEFTIKKIQAGSMAKAFRIALECIIELPDDGPVMVQEDDYLYISGAEPAILEALQYGDYITCYTHPDKWWLPENGGNPYVEQENISEVTRIIQCKTRYWMITNSTTCTFATTPKVIREDYEYWMEGTKDLINTLDFKTFMTLREKNRRYVLQPLPTLATHVMENYLSPLVATEISTWTDVVYAGGEYNT